MQWCLFANQLSDPVTAKCMATPEFPRQQQVKIALYTACIKVNKGFSKNQGKNTACKRKPVFKVYQSIFSTPKL